MIEFKVDRFVIGLWYVEVGAHLMRPLGGNVMGTMWRDPEDAPDQWRMQMRYRYYCGEKRTPETLRQSGDRFNWYEGTAGGTEAEAKQRQDKAFAIIAALAGSKLEFFEVRGDGDRLDEIVQAGKAPPWFHVAPRAEPSQV